MTELSNAVRGKLQNDLSDFLHSYDGAKECVASPTPEIFCSGTIINGFTPLSKRETDSLLFAIKTFKVNVVLVIDYEKLEKDVLAFIKQEGLDVKVIKVPKSPGIESHVKSEELFTAY